MAPSRGTWQSNRFSYVFLHGLNGNPTETWTHETDDGSGFFWPRQLLADLPGCRVMSFGYNAAFERALVENTTTINAIAQTLTSRLIDKGKGESINRPLVFIAHSLGGLVIKRILKAIAAATFKKAPEKLMKALSAHSTELQDLSDGFERTTLFTQHLIEICTYFETKTTKFAGEEPIAKEHAKMAKFPSAQDDLYQSICERLRDMGNDGLAMHRARQATYRVLQIPSSITREQAAHFISTCGQSLGGTGLLGSPSNIRVHSLASRVGQDQSTKMATVTFVRVPLLLLNRKAQWSLPFLHENTHGIITIDATFSGFTVLNDVQENEHVVDVVAIPSLGYHPFTAWQHDPGADSFMWLRDSLPKSAAGAQVFLYGYDDLSHDSDIEISIESIALLLISDLRGIGRSSLSAKPLGFLAHSLGGVVLKQCLIELANAGQSEMFMLQKVKAWELAAMIRGKRFNGLLKELQAAKNVGYLSALNGMDGSKSLDQFPIVKAHCDALRLRPGSQTIGTIAAYLREATEAVPATLTAPRNTNDGSSRWASLSFRSSWASWTGIASYLGPSVAGASGTGQTRGTMPGGLGNEANNGDSRLYDQFISTLRLHGREREEAIIQATTGTFNWIWTDNFASWLTDARPLFWIRGKPGSGKSTLMGYIWNHDELARLLPQESHDRPVIKAAFFFHYRGSHVQKSFEGMLHSILFRILQQEPRLAKVLLPEFAKLEPRQRELWTWNLPRLMAAYESLLVQNTLPVNLVLFIDALDEYDGPPKAMVDFIRTSLEKSSKGATRLKVCFSSREWAAFEENFTREPGFRIHERTYYDIREYVLSRLSSGPGGLTEDRGSDMHDILRTITKRANGVFVWVRVVMDEICRLFPERTPLNELLQYLEAAPGDLNQLYIDAVNRIPHEYRTEANFIFEGEHHPAPLKERGAGLIEVAALGNDGNNHGKEGVFSLQFMHQTVLDFVSQPGFRGIMLGRTFDLPLDNGYSLLAKWLFARAQEAAETAAETATSSPPVAPTINVLALSESTTGKSMKGFLDALEPLVIRLELRCLGVDEHISDPRIAFAAVQNLSILMQEYIREHNGRISQDHGGFSALHCLCRVAQWPLIHRNNMRYSDVHGAGRETTTIVFPIEMPVNVPAAPLLLRHGARVDATYRGETPWQILFRELPSRKFVVDVIQDNPQINALARHLLMAGQDPNVDVLISGGGATVGKALHVAPRGLAELLLEFGARVNALDGTGQTPLDLACRVRTSYRYSMAPQREKEEPARREAAYDLALLLMSHGAKLTRRGQRKWLYLCAKSNLWS
ncbi:hypothetical protein N658DRAFT_490443, partial [Parathielavia hyrcaniae]